MSYQKYFPFLNNTTRISKVFLSGKEFDRAALDQVLRNAEAAAKPRLQGETPSSLTTRHPE
jgi:hypothetical protein